MFAKFKSGNQPPQNPIDANPITQYFEIGKAVACAGPELVWKIHDAYRKSDGKVSWDKPENCELIWFDGSGNVENGKCTAIESGGRFWNFWKIHREFEKQKIISYNHNCQLTHSVTNPVVAWIFDMPWRRVLNVFSCRWICNIEKTMKHFHDKSQRFKAQFKNQSCDIWIPTLLRVRWLRDLFEIQKSDLKVYIRTVYF